MAINMSALDKLGAFLSAYKDSGGDKDEIIKAVCDTFEFAFAAGKWLSYPENKPAPDKRYLCDRGGEFEIANGSDNPVWWSMYVKRFAEIKVQA